MKKVLCVLAVLAVVSVASAGIDLFLTKQTAADNTYIGTTTSVGNRFNQAATKFTLSASATASPGALSHGPFDLGFATVTHPVSATFYVWAKFTNIPVYFGDWDGTGEPYEAPGYIQIYGLSLGSGTGEVGHATLAESATYRQVIAADGIQRWGNTGPMPFPYDTATTGLGTSTGLVAPKPSDTLVKQFGETDAYYVLIGAFSYTAIGEYSMYFGLGNPTPFLGVRYLDPTAATVIDWDARSLEACYPYLTVMGQPYIPGDTQPRLAIRHIPEPGSVILLGVASLLIRRR